MPLAVVDPDSAVQQGPRNQSSRRATALVVALLAFGLAVRLRQYWGCPSFWYDEAYFVVNILHRSCAQLVGSIDESVVAPPGYLWLLRGIYLWAGSSEWAMRLPALVAGLASLFLMMPLAYRVAGRPGWVWAVGFCAVSTHAQNHSNEVRSYASDFALTLVILLLAWESLTTQNPRLKYRVYLAGLLILAIVAPWVSLSSVFVLGGVSAALFIVMVVQRTRAASGIWFAFNLLLGLSSFLLWYYDARELNYPGLREQWGPNGWRGFPPDGCWQAVLTWMGKCLIGIGNYGLDGMGIPLCFFGLMGLVIYCRRAARLALLFIGPILLALSAALAGRYPLADRTVFFALPCLWLLAATGIGATAVFLRPKIRWIGAVLLAGFLLPSGIATARDFFLVRPRTDYRTALEFVQGQRLAEDLLWVKNPQVFEIYWGKQPGVLGPYDQVAKVVQLACRTRLWMIDSPSPARGREDDVLSNLQALNCKIVQTFQFEGIRVLLIEPSHQAGERRGLSPP
jgi:hypothetical protein